MQKWIEFYPEPVPETSGLWNAQLVTAYSDGSIETSHLDCDFNIDVLESKICALIPDLIAIPIQRMFVAYPTDIRRVAVDIARGY